MAEQSPAQSKNLRRCGLSHCGFASDVVFRLDEKHIQQPYVPCSRAQAKARDVKPEDLPAIEEFRFGGSCKYGLEALEKPEPAVQPYATREIPSSGDVAQRSPSSTYDQRKSLITKFFEGCRKAYAQFEKNAEANMDLLRNRPPTG